MSLSRAAGAGVALVAVVLLAVGVGRSAGAQSVRPDGDSAADAAPGSGAKVMLQDPMQAASPTALNGHMSGRVPLNSGDLQAIEVAGMSGVYFLTGNGRFVIRGELRDLWTGQTLDTLDEIRSAVQTVNVTALAKSIPEFTPFRVGHGSKTEIVFVDPYCPYCKLLLNDIATRGEDADYQYVILPVAMLGARSVRVVRNLQCAADRDAALKALLTHSYDRPLAESAKCDIAPLEKRQIFAQLLHIAGVPFMIRHDGIRQDGLPPSLAGWLRQARG
jgi:thiol:disulfide interchange protein DsbC